jgi:hypothetical protein
VAKAHHQKQQLEGSAQALPKSRWVSERYFSSFSGVQMQTLCNWGYADRLAGRSGAEPGKPRYKKFGRSVGYWIELAEGTSEAA